MALPLSAYTTSAEVRALLGVTSKELKDEQLALPMYRRLLSTELDELDPQLEADYEALANLPSPDATQEKFKDLVQLYSSYAIALHLVPSLEQFAPQKITDGRAEVQRSESDLKTLISGLEYGEQRLRTKLLDVYKILNPGNNVETEILPFTMVIGSTLPVDPVVG